MDTQKTIPISVNFNATVANEPDTRERLRVWFVKSVHELRMIDHEFVPDNAAEATLVGGVLGSFSGWNGANFVLGVSDIPPERHGDSDPPDAPPAGPDSAGN